MTFVERWQRNTQQQLIADITELINDLRATIERLNDPNPNDALQTALKRLDNLDTPFALVHGVARRAVDIELRANELTTLIKTSALSD